MGKAKSKAIVMVASADGGMAQVQDRRFVANDWPIQFEVQTEQADSWLQYLTAECSRRDWSSGGISQLEARQNSGSLTINPLSSGQSLMEVVWERKRGEGLKIRARVPDGSALTLTDAQALFGQVNESCRAGALEQIYRRGVLEYQGLAWRGELWLDDKLRLGPPTIQYEGALMGPRIIIVDAMIDCIGRWDAMVVFNHKLRELSAFLSVVKGGAVRIPKTGWAWTYLKGLEDCEVRAFGYFEPSDPQAPVPSALPARGTSRAMPLRKVSRPDFSERGVDGSTNEQTLPDDIVDLWGRFCALSPDGRRNFLQAAAKWQEAMTHWGEERTLSFALLVVACETLKPSEREFREHNIYDVVEGLLGKPVSHRLQENWFRPQNTRNAHLHRGEFRSSEFVRRMMMSSFEDPTFDSAHRELTRIT